MQPDKAALNIFNRSLKNINERLNTSHIAPIFQKIQQKESSRL